MFILQVARVLMTSSDFRVFDKEQFSVVTDPLEHLRYKGKDRIAPTVNRREPNTRVAEFIQGWISTVIPLVSMVRFSKAPRYLQIGNTMLYR